MPDVKMPFSGNVMQSILPWTSYFNPVDSQFGLITINLGKSSDPAMEHQVLSDVASYGKQLGRIGEALEVLLNHFQPQTQLTPAENKAIKDVRRLLEDIADVKNRPAKSL